MKIAIDFDGVICKRDGIPTKSMNGHEQPVKGALDTVKLLKGLGHEVWVFTSHEDRDEVKIWMEKHGFPIMIITNIKIPAHIYIDDRAIRFTNWQDIRKYFA